MVLHVVICAERPWGYVNVAEKILERTNKCDGHDMS
jgi:hypothetical protein